MPTNRASYATAPRICSTSAASVCSASGKVTKRVAFFVEPGLKDQLRRNRIAGFRACCAMHAGSAQLEFGDLGRVAFVDAQHGQAEASFERPRELVGLRGDLVRGAIGVHGPASDERLRVPY